jgi:hypothetical protein
LFIGPRFLPRIPQCPFLAISFRRAALTALARAFPSNLPPSLSISESLAAGRFAGARRRIDLPLVDQSGLKGAYDVHIDMGMPFAGADGERSEIWPEQNSGDRSAAGPV